MLRWEQLVTSGGKYTATKKINKNEVFCESIGAFQASGVIHVNESCAYSVREHKSIAHEEIRTNSLKTPDEIKLHKSDPIIDFRTMFLIRENFFSINKVVKGDPMLEWEFELTSQNIWGVWSTVFLLDQAQKVCKYGLFGQHVKFWLIPELCWHKDLLKCAFRKT